MQMVQANTTLVPIHSQLVYLDVELTQRSFCQLVHNTDDDSLSLLIIVDLFKPVVKEVALEAKLLDPNWDLLRTRYGQGN